MKNTQATVVDLLRALEALPDVYVDHSRVAFEAHEGHHRYDARVEVRVGERPVTLLIEVKRTVYPRDARDVLWQFKDFAQRISAASEHAVQPVVAAESISTGARELLRAQGFGYFDSGGSLFIPARGAYLYIDKPPQKSLQREIRTLFAGRRAQVLLALLVRHKNWFGVHEIAAQAKVAPSTASEVLSQLDRFDWLESRGQGRNKERYLREPGALLDSWREQLPALRSPKVHRYFVSGFKSDPLLQHLVRVLNFHKASYAVTSEAAAQHYSPFLSTVPVVRIRLLSDSAAGTAMKELGVRTVNEGFNFVTFETQSEGDLLFREHLEGVWFAHPVQVYIDLLRGEGRAKELANHLRSERLDF